MDLIHLDLLDTFPDLIANGTTSADWAYVRITANHYSNGPVRTLLFPSRILQPTEKVTQVTDVTDQAIRCYELDYNATPGETGTATVSAGSVVGFKADNTMGHPGVCPLFILLRSRSLPLHPFSVGTTFADEHPPV